MTEPLPPDLSGSGLPAETPPPPPPAKKPWPLSRKILLAVLAILLAMLGFDYFHGRMAKDAAYDKLRKAYFDEGAAKPRAMIQKDEPVPADHVHKTLGRDPDRVEDNPAKAARLMQDDDSEGVGIYVPADKVEIYRFAGGLRAYVVRVAYRKSKNADGATEYQLMDMNSGTEPLFGSSDK